MRTQRRWACRSMPISAVTGEGVPELLETLWPYVAHVSAERALQRSRASATPAADDLNRPVDARGRRFGRQRRACAAGRARRIPTHEPGPLAPGGARWHPRPSACRSPGRRPRRGPGSLAGRRVADALARSRAQGGAPRLAVAPLRDGRAGRLRRRAARGQRLRAGAARARPTPGTRCTRSAAEGFAPHRRFSSSPGPTRLQESRPGTASRRCSMPASSPS